MRTLLATAIAALLPMAALSADESALEPSLQLSVPFGGPQARPDPSLRLALAADAPADADAPELIGLEFTGRGVGYRVAGNLVAVALDGEPAAKAPNSTWMWWTGGAIAVTAAILASSSGGGEPDESDNPDGRGGVNCDDAGNCTIPCPGPSPDSCVGFTGGPAPATGAFDPALAEWLDAGTGHMGLLFEVPAP